MLNAADPIHQIKTTVGIVRLRSDSVKRARCTLSAKTTGTVGAEAQPRAFDYSGETGRLLSRISRC